MSHTLGIVGHTDRAELIHGLLDHVRPDVLSLDNGQLGCEGNHYTVWNRLANEYPRSGWAVVLEDDALPVAGFDTQLESALRVAPTPVVSLYLGRLRPPQHQAAIAAAINNAGNAHWLIGTRLLHAVGVAIRTSLIPDMLDHIETYPVCTRPIDEAIGIWARARSLRVAYTWPSLVDHADQDTLVRHPDGRERTPGRVAWRAGTRDTWTRQQAELAA